MRYLLIALLSVFSTLAMAQGEVPAANASATVQASDADDSSQDLDIAKVVRGSSESSKECGPVKGHMVYVDSHGVRHELDYVRLGDACQHG
ncbi:DUF2790 domain-containing protein [Pseudomonas sp. ADAK18]|uniref:DUF2790 domain-containing protein n=1 Tax=Pseudomonas sp. ADAK18 TaxID=2730848 RepID=UPI001463F94E|nr:DUF2790 domain-containing protein [Pseudomonas sp. ADAK18]QJI29049.1 DUF2790 domain-containing protein [Pseudomonas sp. ADAK18]